MGGKGVGPGEEEELARKKPPRGDHAQCQSDSSVAGSGVRDSEWPRVLSRRSTGSSSAAGGGLLTILRLVVLHARLWARQREAVDAHEEDVVNSEFDEVVVRTLEAKGLAGLHNPSAFSGPNRVLREPGPLTAEPLNLG
jgi:hypothetical protein